MRRMWIVLISLVVMPCFALAQESLPESFPTPNTTPPSGETIQDGTLFLPAPSGDGQDGVLTPGTLTPLQVQTPESKTNSCSPDLWIRILLDLAIAGGAVIVIETILFLVRMKRRKKAGEKEDSDK